MPWTAADIPDQSGRLALITGASSGLRLETARALTSALRYSKIVFFPI